MSKRYWELFGPVRKTVLEMMESRRLKLREAADLVKKLGADQLATAESGLGVEIAAVFKTPPDPKLWKANKHNKEAYHPRKTSKEGREIDKQFYELGRSIPNGMKMAEVIEMEVFNGCQWYTPGVTLSGKRVFVSTPDTYEPPTKLKRHIKRVSDLDYEKITGKGQAA